MQITQIQQAENNENRVNLFLDNQFWIGIDKDELITLQIFKGQEIDDEFKSKVEESSLQTKLFNKAVNYIQIRPRSEKEIKDYLKRKYIEPSTSSEIIEKLKRRNLLSDEEFANWYISNRLNSGKYGEVRIKSELIKKGVSKRIIEQAFTELMTEEETESIELNAFKYAQKSISTTKAKTPYELKTKLIKKLMNRGFSYDLSKKVVGDVIKRSIQ